MSHYLANRRSITVIFNNLKSRKLKKFYCRTFITVKVIMNMINGIETSYRMVSTWLTFFYSHATDEGFELKKNCN